MTHRPIRLPRRRLRSCRPRNIQPAGIEYLGIFVGVVADHAGVFRWSETIAICGDPSVGAVVRSDRIAHVVAI